MTFLSAPYKPTTKLQLENVTNKRKTILNLSGWVEWRCLGRLTLRDLFGKPPCWLLWVGKLKIWLVLFHRWVTFSLTLMTTRHEASFCKFFSKSNWYSHSVIFSSKITRLTERQNKKHDHQKVCFKNCFAIKLPEKVWKLEYDLCSISSVTILPDLAQNMVCSRCSPQLLQMKWQLNGGPN